MFRLSSTVCPFCEVRASIKASNPSWQLSRNAATLQKRKPSRMILSAKVAIPQTETATSNTKRPPFKRNRNGPFGGMNVTHPPVIARNTRNKDRPAESGRPSRMRDTKRQEDNKKKDGPMKALKMQRALANVSYEKRARIKHAIEQYDSFDEFNLLPLIMESVSSQALKGMVDVSPTPIQRLAIPALLGTVTRRRKKPITPIEAKKEMQQFLLAAETGSGKTLAYALPVIDAIKRAEWAEKEQSAKENGFVEARKSKAQKNFEFPMSNVDTPDPSTGRPRAIILLPTSELVSQVGALVKSLSHTVKFRAAMISASFSGAVIRNRLFSPSGIDVLISTPHLLKSITESDPNVLSRVSHLVIDEADSLLDRSFSPITSDIIDRAAPSLEQLILCSATIPRSLNSYLDKRYPDAKRLATPNLHSIPRRVQLSVLDIEKVPYQGNRDLACAQTIIDIGKEATDYGAEREKKIVVFVNEREKAGELATYLRSKNINAQTLSRDSDERKDSDVLAAFTGSGTTASTTSRIADTAISPGDLAESSVQTLPQAKPSFSNTKVLVMTDLGSRGIDTLLVKHVILYDVPHTSIDFIHRLGRLGRMGRRGRGIVLVGRHDRKDIVREVREGMFKGQALI